MTEEYILDKLEEQRSIYMRNFKALKKEMELKIKENNTRRRTHMK